MSKPRRDKDYLADILEALNRVESYTSGLDYDKFMTDIKTQDAVIRNLEVIGEATKNISDDLKDRYAYIPWKALAGVRDKLIHHYFGVNYEIVWNIVQNEAPLLLSQIDEVVVKESVTKSNLE